MQYRLSLSVFLVLGAVSVQASSVYVLHSWSPARSGHHHRLSAPRPVAVSPLVSLSKRQSRTRCKGPRSASNTSVSQSVLNPSSAPSPTSGTINDAASSSAKQPESPQAIPKELIDVASTACGGIGATKNVTATSGPNGSIDWLNCGIDGTGWSPPYLTVKDIVTVELSDALQDPDTPFKPCEAYVSTFEKYANQYDVPAILLASFAMQESSCDPTTVGGAGEQGLMQLTPDKCDNAPGGNCKDPDYNIRTGTALFADTLSANQGSLLLAIGGYNGWTPKLTIAEATAAAITSCCRCQQNLDYLMQFMNGWALNINAYTYVPRLGKYFNLDKCD